MRTQTKAGKATTLEPKTNLKVFTMTQKSGTKESLTFTAPALRLSALLSQS